MSYKGPAWLIDNQRKTKKRYPEPIHILWIGFFSVAALVLFFIPATQILWLWVPMLVLLVLGGVPTKNGPGFLVAWDRYAHLTRQKKPKETAKKNDVGVEEGEDTSSDSNGKVSRQKRKPPINTIPMEYYDSTTDSYTGVLYMPPRIADAATIVSTGFDGAMLGSDEFFERIDSISESVVEAARASVVPIGITHGFMKRPYDITRSRDWQLENVSPKIMASVPGTTWQEVALGKSVAEVIADASKKLDRPLTAAEVLHQDMIERDTLKQKRASDAYAFYSLLVPRPEEWPLGSNGIINGLLSQQQLNDAPIVRLTKLVEQGLVAHGALGVHRLDLDGLNNHLMKAWNMNPNTLMPWNEGATRTADGRPFDPTNPWPPPDFYTASDPKGMPYIDYGGTWHRIYQINGLEHKLIRPRQLQPLYQPGALGPTDEVGYGAALAAETVLSSDEVRAATRSIRLKKAIRRVTGADTGDRDESAREREEAELLENQRDAFDYGGTHGFTLNFYIDLAVYEENDKARTRRLMEVDEKFRLIIRDLRIATRAVRLAPHMNRTFWTMFGGTGMM